MDIRKQAIDAQEGFEYINKCGTQIWECGKPGTNIYRFEIVVGSYGIYMSGDIDSLVWSRMGRRGISFLAGDDVEYYIYSKLDPVYTDMVELDEDAVQRVIDTWEEQYGEPIDPYLAEDLNHIRAHPDSSSVNRVASLIYEATGDFEVCITKPKHSVMFSLHMACLAARRICAAAEGKETTDV